MGAYPPSDKLKRVKRFFGFKQSYAPSVGHHSPRFSDI